MTHPRAGVETASGGECGDFEGFENLCRLLVDGVRVKQSCTTEDDPADSRNAKSTKRGRLRAKERARLARALESLPKTIRYLREPILAIADEDQDLLGEGEADTTLLAQAIKQQGSMHSEGFAGEHAEALERWLQDVATPEKGWAAPAWFVQAFLMGYEMFDMEREQGQ